MMGKLSWKAYLLYECIISINSQDSLCEITVVFLLLWKLKFRDITETAQS